MASTCGICQVDLHRFPPGVVAPTPNETPLIRSTNCSHLFHDSCLNSYIREQSTRGNVKCPMCPASILDFGTPNARLCQYHAAYPGTITSRGGFTSESTGFGVNRQHTPTWSPSFHNYGIETGYQLGYSAVPVATPTGFTYTATPHALIFGNPLQNPNYRASNLNRAPHRAPNPISNPAPNPAPNPNPERRSETHRLRVENGRLQAEVMALHVILERLVPAGGLGSVGTQCTPPTDPRRIGLQTASAGTQSEFPFPAPESVNLEGMEQESLETTEHLPALTERQLEHVRQALTNLRQTHGHDASRGHHAPTVSGEAEAVGDDDSEATAHDESNSCDDISEDDK